MTKRIALVLLLVPLVLFELLLCTSFLPDDWQHAIDKRIPKILSGSHNDQSLITHRNMSGEIEDALRNSVRLRICLYALIALILVMNTLLVRLIWRLLLARGSVSATHS
jgi:hypothetical protein